jgi:hypothetical protein
MRETTDTATDSAERPAELPSSVACVRCLTNLGGVRLDGACPKCELPAAVSVPAPVRIMIKEGLRRAPDGLMCQRCGQSLGGLGLKDVCPRCELSVDTSIEGGGWQPALTDDGAVVADTPCVRCGYNLRGLHESRDCPECGLPARRTIAGDFICFADPAWARRIARGAALISHVIWLFVVLFVAVIVATLLADLLRFRKRDVLAWSIALSLPVVIGLGCLGLLLMTAPEHTWVPSDPSARRRRAARLGLIGSIVTTVMVRIAVWTPGAFTALQMAGVALQFASLAVGLIGYFGYLAMLSDRIPDARLSRVSNSLRVGLGYSIAALTVCFMLMSISKAMLPQRVAQPVYVLAAIVALTAGVLALGSALRAIFFHSRLAAALAHEADLATENRRATGDT